MDTKDMAEYREIQSGHDGFKVEYPEGGQAEL